VSASCVLAAGSHYFNGHVIFMTNPPHVPNCEHASVPGQVPRPPPAEPDVTRAAHYWQHVRYAEAVWYSAFQKWAPRLKLSVLNVTHLSELRADAHLPPHTDSDGTSYGCGHLCLPGVPHVWAELLLCARLALI
jgi:hypothetical protein